MYDLSNPGDVVGQMCEAGMSLAEIKKTLRRAIDNIDYALFYEANPDLSDDEAFKLYHELENIPY